MKKIIKKILVIIILIMSFSINCNAAQIEIVPSSSVLTNVTVSTSYLTCRNLDSVNSTLGTTGLDPHLVTNADWGAVSYLAHSIYGVNATYDGSTKIGRKVTIEGIEFYSTTPNVTGVMNWGKTTTQTAGLLADLINLGDEETIKSKINDVTYKNTQLLIKNIGTKYIEKLAQGLEYGRAMAETSSLGSYQTWWYQTNCPVGIRNGYFSFLVGNWHANGTISTSITFRPAIWNL